MIEILKYINPAYIQVIEPLRKWKILSLEALRYEAKYEKSDASFYKVIKRLEDNNIISSFIESHSKKKYVHLWNESKVFFDIEPFELIPRERRYHDASTIEFVRRFQVLNNFVGIISDNELRNNLTRHHHLPDALVKIDTKEGIKNLAIETELSQKTKKRIIDIFNYYEKSSEFDYCIYYFKNLFMRDRYFELYKSNFPEGKKILFVCNFKHPLGKLECLGSLSMESNEFKYGFNHFLYNKDLMKSEHFSNGSMIKVDKNCNMIVIP